MRRVPTHIPALLCAAGCLTASMPAMAQQTAPVRSGQTMGMRYLSWSGKPVLAARPVVEAVPAAVEPAPAAILEAAPADPAPMRAALPERDPFDAPPPRRTGPIIPRRPIMTMSAAVPAPPSPSVEAAASQGLTPASTWLDATPASEIESGPRPYVATASAAPYAEGTVTPYVNLAPVDAEPTPPAYEPPVRVAPAFEASAPPTAYDPPPPAYSPPAYEAPVVEAPVVVAPAVPPPPEPVPEAVPLDPPAPAVDPMAPRADAPVFRMSRDAPSAPEPAVEPSAETEAAPAAEPAAAAPVDPMAPRPDAPVFRLRPQSSPVAAATDHPASEGARYYSVHRQAGHAPDATPLPQGVFLDSLPVDLAEPPPPPAVTRDRDGNVRAIVPNEDPSLP